MPWSEVHCDPPLSQRLRPRQTGHGRRRGAHRSAAARQTQKVSSDNRLRKFEQAEGQCDHALVEHEQQTAHDHEDEESGEHVADASVYEAQQALNAHPALRQLVPVARL